MAIIGNTVTSVPFIADSFSGNASTTSFSPLTRAPAGTASIAVFIAGTYQSPGTYTLSGTTITFSSAPASGVGNIIVLHLGNGSATQVPSDGSVTITKLSNDTYGYINAAFTSANAAFATANTGTASGSYANSAFATANTGTAAGSYANSAFATANTGTAAGSYANSAFTVANNSLGIDTTQNTNITSAASYANGAFAKANTAGVGTVTSVSGTNGLTGTVTSSGSLSVDTTFGNVGTYAILSLWTSTGLIAGATASGSVLGYVSALSTNGTNNGLPLNSPVRAGNVQVPGSAISASWVTTTAASGTWRTMGGTLPGGYNACDNNSSGYPGLWVRIS